MTLIVDSHCHLDQPQFDEDRDEVLARAAAAGVGAIVNPAVDLASCRKVLALADAHPQVYAALGVHPNDCAGFDENTVAELRALARHPKVVAIGEIGLDYYWEAVDHEQQRRTLRAQLTLAAELDLPVILHSRSGPEEKRSPGQSEAGGPAPGRDANADLMWELAQWGPEIRNKRGPDAMLGVLHAFSGDLAAAETAYNLGFLLSLGGPVTFKNARVLHALVPKLDPGRLMLETDAPYLAPHPYRGQRNEPAYLPLVAESLADLFGLTAGEVIARTTAAAQRCFRGLGQTL